jgi:RsiW-degrading membrane proteinase PrsW (M82 family)
VRGRTLLGTLPVEQAVTSPLVVSFGDDILSYTRAYHARLLLGSCNLPPLRRTAAATVPPRWGLATACAALPCLLSIAWLAFVRRFDRARPEPLWLVTATFVLGGLSVLPAGLAEYAFGAASPWLDPSVVTLGGQLRALPLSVAVGTLVVGVSEEGAKLLSVLILAWRRREFDEPVDGVVYSSAAALGFAAAENAKYFAVGRMSGTVVALRGFVTVPAHMFFAAIWGYALGQALVSRKSRMPEAFALAALAHGAFDALLSTDGAQLVATGLVLVLAASFVGLLRQALRHGPVRRAPAPTDTPLSTEPAPASLMERTSYRVGSSRAFYSFAALMVVSAFGLTVLGTAYELLRHRVGPVFVTLAGAVLGLFGLAAYEASETIPLDVVLDARGLTYSGVRLAWSALRSVATTGRGKRWYVVVDSAEGSTRLGPTSQAEAGAVANAIRSSLREP